MTSSRRRGLSIAGALSLALVLPFLVAQTGPIGGLPSKPKFTAVGVGAVAPSSGITSAGTVNITAQQALSANSVSPRLCWQETDAAANEIYWTLIANGGDLSWYANADSNPCTTTAGSRWMRLQRTGTTVDSVELTATTVTLTGNVSISGTATIGGATPVAETTGTFTGSYATACTTTPTSDFKWSKIGNTVTLMNTQAVSCTSDSTIFALDAASLPAGIRPAANQCVVGAGGVDSGAATDVIMRVETGGGINFAKGIGGSTTACSATAWTSSGTKGLSQFSITYLVN